MVFGHVACDYSRSCLGLKDQWVHLSYGGAVATCSVSASSHN